MPIWSIRPLHIAYAVSVCGLPGPVLCTQLHTQAEDNLGADIIRTVSLGKRMMVSCSTELCGKVP